MTNLFYIPLIVLGAWLLYPILYPAPVEGFSAAIIGLGVHLAQGDLAGFDPLQPFHIEFFALSKFGAVLGIAGLVKVFGIDGAAALKFLTWGGQALLLISTFILARRWSGASPLVTATAVLLVPGVIENSFYYADNVLAVGLTTAAFVCFGTRSHILAPLIGGALFGLGVLTRPDVILAGIAVPLLVLGESGFTRRSAMALVAAAVGGAVTWLGPLFAFGVTPLDVLKVGQHAFSLADRVSYPRHVREAVIFLGLPATLLAAIGVVALIRQRALLRLAILLAPIIVVNAAFVGNLWQSRQLMSLAPFVVALTAIGVMQLLPSPASSRAGLWVRGAVAAVVAAILFVPSPGGFDDGPRDLIGRVPGIAHWREWQEGVSAEMATIRGAVETDRPGLRVIITDDWNPDRYVHLAIVDAGFRPQAPARFEPACAQIAEHFERGAQRLLHVRIYQGFVKGNIVLNRGRHDTLVRPCLDAVAPVETVLVAGEDRVQFIRGGGDVTMLWPPQASSRLADWMQRLFPPRSAFITAVPVDAAMLDQMSRAYAAIEAEARKRFAARGYVPINTVEEGLAATQRIIPFPKDD
ncbi:MAG: hypothetical protein HC900_01840 [Methylacidiphilales bacterium]|nr:hypothetical protein [Candidatus Methylacidiphilales bacterium]